MPRRRTPPGKHSSGRIATSARRSEALQSRVGSANAQRPAAVTRWRQRTRLRIVHSAVVATKSLRWSPTLIETLLEELHTDEGFDALLGATPKGLPRHKYAQAVAVALILRHSWRADDLAHILKRLRLKVGRLPTAR